MKYAEALNHVNAFLHAPYHAAVAALVFLSVLWYVIYRQYDNDAPKKAKREPKPSKARKSSRKGKSKKSRR